MSEISIVSTSGAQVLFSANPIDRSFQICLVKADYTPMCVWNFFKCDRSFVLQIAREDILRNTARQGFTKAERGRVLTHFLNYLEIQGRETP